MNAFFTNSQRPVVDCLTVAAGILARSQEVIKGTGADQRFAKNALKICVLPAIYYKYQYRLTYTLCSELNSVPLYESERTREEIFIRIKGDNMSTF